MNVDDELRRLFADDRLDLPVRADAERTITAGARRLRARRTTLTRAGVAAALVGLVGVPLALARADQNEPAPASRTPAGVAATSIPPSPTSPPGAPPVTSGGATITNRPSPPPQKRTPIGPDGYGALALGMTAAQAEATGLIAPNAQPRSSAGCLGYDYKGVPNQPDHYSVLISPRYGVVRIAGRPDAATPEGVTAGTSEADVRRIYPAQAPAHGAVGEWVASAPGNPAANYWIIIRNRAVAEIRLELAVQDCYS